jgi:hypothetical protein
MVTKAAVSTQPSAFSHHRLMVIANAELAKHPQV